MGTTSVAELHVSEDGVRIALHHVRNDADLGQRLAIVGAARHVSEGLQRRYRERLLAVVVRDVLRIDREPEVLVVLVAYAEDPAVEVQRIGEDGVGVGQQPPLAS